MSRISRNSFETSFFHIMVQGINKEYIFSKKIYMEKYINLILGQMQDYNIQILAYCIMNNHAHILIYTEKIEYMSKYMHYINTLYAQYYNFMENNRVGHVFRDRYKSEPIVNEMYLVNCIKYIHNNPVKAGIVQKEIDYQYSSYMQFKEGGMSDSILKDIIDINLVLESNNHIDEIFIDIENDTNIRDIIDYGIRKFEIENKILLKEIIKNEEMILKLVKELKEKYKISQKDILNEIKISKSKYGRIQQKRENGKNGDCPYSSHKEEKNEI